MGISAPAAFIGGFLVAGFLQVAIGSFLFILAVHDFWKS
jgi:hypothetical protein